MEGEEEEEQLGMREEEGEMDEGGVRKKSMPEGKLMDCYMYVQVNVCVYISLCESGCVHGDRGMAHAE